MRFSLIVTSADRERELRRFFSSIEQQMRGCEIEVVFVNQGIDSPPRILGREDSLHVIEIRTTGRIPLSAARNLGLKVANGEILAFPDDDCWYGPDLLLRIAQYFEEHLDVDCICTSVYDPELQCSYGGRPLDLKCKINFANLFRLGLSVGIFVRRSALERAGHYFDESLGAGTQIGSGEETELLARILETKARIQFTGDFKVFHAAPQYSVSDIPKSFKYGVGYGYLVGQLLKRSHWLVLADFLNVATRSAGGALVNIRIANLRSIYTNRFRGVFWGLFTSLVGRGAL